MSVLPPFLLNRKCFVPECPTDNRPHLLSHLYEPDDNVFLMVSDEDITQWDNCQVASEEFTYISQGSLMFRRWPSAKSGVYKQFVISCDSGTITILKHMPEYWCVRVYRYDYGYNLPPSIKLRATNGRCSCDYAGDDNHKNGDVWYTKELPEGSFCTALF